MMVPFVGGGSEYRSRDVSAQRSVNLYPEFVDVKNPKTGAILIGTPGTETFSDLGDIGICRGMWYTSTSRLFAVYGGNLYEFDNAGAYTNKGNIGLLATPVSMTDNGKYLVFADGVKMRTYNLDTGGTITEITIPFDNPTQIGYVDNRIVAINNDITLDETDPLNTRENNKFYWSDAGFDGPLTWGALSWASAESSADAIESLAVKEGEIWLFGPRSYEAWRTNTNPDLPFSKVGGSDSAVGSGATYGVSNIGDNIFWLGTSTAGQNQVFMSNGYGHQRISNHSIEYELDKMGVTEDAQGFAYQQEGHTFYVLNFITGDKTLVYDITTNEWHERATRDPNLNILHRWDPIYASYAFGKVVVGNSRDSKVLTLNLDKYDEYDSRPIVRIRQSPVYWEDLRELFHREFQIDLDTGHGVQTGQGSDPQGMLQYSDDGGNTWSSERWTGLGKIGQYKTRVRFRRLGRSRERVYRFQISDPIKVVLIGARVIAESGSKP